MVHMQRRLTFALEHFDQRELARGLDRCRLYHR
jgi:hypothetical protein